MGIIYSKCYNGVIMVPGFADDRRLATSASPTRDIFSTKFSLKRGSAGGKCVYSVT